MPTGDRQRLADYVIARRMKIGIKDRRAFQRQSGLSDRTIGTVERGGQVSPATLGAIENTLGWAPGSAQRVLAGGEPILLDAAGPGDRRPRGPVYADPVEQAVWEALADVAITDDPAEDERIRRGLIHYLRARREEEPVRQSG